MPRRRRHPPYPGPHDPEPEEGPGFCTECGQPIEWEHKFCGYCGHKAR